MKIGIVGAGLVGRLLAWHLCQQEHEVHLLSKDSIEGEKACSLVAAGLICPMSELPLLPKSWYPLGLQALRAWPKLLASLSLPVYYQANGTLVVTHPSQRALLLHFIKSLQNQDQNITLSELNQRQLNQFEPELTNVIGCYLANEARIDPVDLLKSLADFILKQGVKWHENCEVLNIGDLRIDLLNSSISFDKIVDCRGLGAKNDLTGLRGVRGEIITCFAPQISLQHTLRFLHERYPCYIVPRANSIFVIGATQLESENNAPVSIRSVLRLLSSAVSVHPEFYEATILKMQAACRPTLPTHMPIVVENEGVTQINGMFRHGFLLAPAMIENVVKRLRNENDDKRSRSTVAAE